MEFWIFHQKSRQIEKFESIIYQNIWISFLYRKISSKYSEFCFLKIKTQFHEFFFDIFWSMYESKIEHYLLTFICLILAAWFKQNKLINSIRGLIFNPCVQLENRKTNIRLEYLHTLVHTHYIRFRTLSLFLYLQRESWDYLRFIFALS